MNITRNYQIKSSIILKGIQLICLSQVYHAVFPNEGNYCQETILLWVIQVFYKFVSDSTVKLEMPTISLSSPFAMVIYSPDRIAVSKGSSFSITCSTHSTFPGGFFYLTKSNMTRTEAKQAFRHSIFYLTVFDFSVMEDKDQGDYTCIFGVNISSTSFCSVPSKPLQIKVTGETLMNL